jgi:hypothetical protein
MMRQDPEYYRLYVTLRPDNHYMLISYPYYMKYARSGDKTFFRHIDMNITQYLADGRGGNMIQGTVSLDNETDHCCTEILEGMHTKEKLQEWYDRVKGRATKDKILDAYVNRIDDVIWNKSDKEHFETDFKPVPCQAGDVRVTSPLLPHGSTTTPEGAIRRTMLPWFVAIQKDHSTMETLEMGTWEDLAEAHRDLKAAPRSPSGKSNMYGSIPYRHPVAVQLKIPSALSDALVGRSRWDMPDVVEERKIVLGIDTKAYAKHLKAWRKDAVKAYVTLFKKQMALEKDIYQHKSFFFNGGDIRKLDTAPEADKEMTDEIRSAIDKIKKVKGEEITELHGQEGADVGTAMGAPTEQDLIERTEALASSSEAADSNASDSSLCQGRSEEEIDE